MKNARPVPENQPSADALGKRFHLTIIRQTLINLLASPVVQTVIHLLFMVAVWRLAQ